MNSTVDMPGKMFLAEDRGLIENATHRRYSTFNFREFQHEHKQPFGDLYLFNDEILPAGGTLLQKTTNSGIMLLIPVVGGIVFEIGGQQYEAEAGEVLTVPVVSHQDYNITNPFDGDWVNFLHIELNGRFLSGKVNKHAFAIEETVNELISVVDDIGLSCKLSIGRFAGRKEFVYTLAPHNKAFAFIIAGAWELQERLMHERDGLALWDTTEIAAEVLSNGAVILLLELKHI